MGSFNKNQFPKRKIDKRFLSKNKTIKLFKEKQSKIDRFKKEADELKQKYEEVTLEKVEKFDDLPLSIRTRKGLNQCGYLNPTEIQKETILLGLKGKDILGAAKTGSGKTLAFVVPLLERLYVSGWTILDGLGGLIITPTRELAYQIYDVINKVGGNHQFSVGLIIGGKDLAKERKLLDKCNIMICTPGRLLQHMDENPLFDSMNLMMLILDEADRILDLGFAKTMNAILENLPQERQTLLFSATQTKSVKDLARLSLKNPVYVSVDEHAKYTTPEALQQSYIVCEAHDKMNMLWSFIKSHKKQKILVFMASCKQVKYTYESICRLRPGLSVMALYGSLHQLRRMQIYDEFCSKINAVMFATDVASRGLDFPNVNWVVQLDCPEDVNTYIHRAGRTARYQKGGESLLVLLPSEKESMIKQLEDRKIPIEEIKANPNKLFDIKKKLETIVFRDKNLKESGDRCFKSYLKSIYMMKDKTVFDVMKVDVNQYAYSLGLNFVPRIRFLEKHVEGYKQGAVNKPSTDTAQQIKNSEDEVIQNLNTSVLDDEDGQKYLKQVSSKFAKLNVESYDATFNDPNPFDFVSSSQNKNVALPEIEPDGIDESKARPIITKAALVKRALKKKTQLNTVVKFDEDGNPLHEIAGKLVPDTAAKLRQELSEEAFSIDGLQQLLEENNEFKKQLRKENVKSKHREEKMKKKEKRWEKNPDGAAATLKSSDDESDQGEDDEPDVDPNNMSASECDEAVSDDDQQLNNEDSSEEADNADVVASESSDGESVEEKSSSEADSSSEDDDEEEVKNVRTKRKLPPAKYSKSKAKKICLRKSIIQENTKKQVRTVDDDEELALKFLNS